MLKNKIRLILKEVDDVLSRIKEDEVNVLIKNIIESDKIVVIGAGRMGLGAKAFAMRLMHLGLNAYSLNDSNLPSIESNDLLIVCSGSGETQTIYDFVSIAKKMGVKITTITAHPDSRIGNLSDSVVEIKAPSKIGTLDSSISIQPMTTLMEQSLFLFFDGLVLELMEKLNISSDQMKIRHSVLE